ncbi:hypothetical protein FA13DRAFT_1731734 [Coprinellus micaceus]|uniref:CBM21 domain-containing protein n=1 Tax=Coprinellus micaceus TaxID=71717 RepID=A0A4Y7TG83_COPMI|nr:hypothetical protein FA13DRAFT_1731734 [Coprinellus micaceus]
MPYTAPQESPSSPQQSPVTYGSSNPSPKGKSRSPASALKPALKLGRSNSVEGPFQDAPPNREARRRSYTTPSLPKPKFLEPGPSSPPLRTPTKTVRFPTDQNALEGVRTFRKHGKPIHISHPASGEETATETEGETSSASGLRYTSSSTLGFFSSLADRARKYPSTNFPKPSLPAIQTSFASVRALIPSISVTHAATQIKILEPIYEIDSTISSPTLQCSSTTPTQISLTGTIIVRNLAYSKHVGVRFTLDDWVTVSNVSARHVASLPSFPLSFFPAKDSPMTPGDAAALLSLVNQIGGWDRFEFTIYVDHASYSLAGRILWLAVRYSIEGGEWWDNNAGQNYKVGFRLCGQPGIVDEPENATMGEGSSFGRGPSRSADFSSQDHSSKTLSPSSANNLGPHYTRSYPHTSHSLTASKLGPHFSLSLAAYSIPQTLPGRHPQCKGEEINDHPLLRPSSWPIACGV